MFLITSVRLFASFCCVSNSTFWNEISQASKNHSTNLALINRPKKFYHDLSILFLAMIKINLTKKKTLISIKFLNIQLNRFKLN